MCARLQDMNPDPNRAPHSRLRPLSAIVENESEISELLNGSQSSQSTLVKQTKDKLPGDKTVRKVDVNGKGDQNSSRLQASKKSSQFKSAKKSKKFNNSPKVTRSTVEIPATTTAKSSLAVQGNKPGVPTRLPIPETRDSKSPVGLTKKKGKDLNLKDLNYEQATGDPSQSVKSEDPVLQNINSTHNQQTTTNSVFSTNTQTHFDTTTTTTEDPLHSRLCEHCGSTDRRLSLTSWTNDHLSSATGTRCNHLLNQSIGEYKPQEESFVATEPSLPEITITCEEGNLHFDRRTLKMSIQADLSNQDSNVLIRADSANEDSNDSTDADLANRNVDVSTRSDSTNQDPVTSTRSDLSKHNILHQLATNKKAASVTNLTHKNHVEIHGNNNFTLPFIGRTSSIVASNRSKLTSHTSLAKLIGSSESLYSETSGDNFPSSPDNLDQGPLIPTDFWRLKETIEKLQLSARRPSTLLWKQQYLEGPGFPQPRPSLTTSDSPDEHMTSERKQRIDEALTWLKTELQEMRNQDQNLARQLLTIRQEIHQLKLQRSTEEHQERIEDFQYELDELDEFSDVLDLPPPTYGINPLKHIGVTRLHFNARRFSAC